MDADEHAGFAGLYDREVRRVVATLRAAGASAAVAEDVAAEAFARAWAAWSRVSAMVAPGGWVVRVAVNELRRRHRRGRLERLALGRLQPSAVADPPDEPDDELWRAVVELSPRARQAVALRYVADLPEAEVAAALGVTRGSVARTLSRARARLQEQLEPTRGGVR